MVVVIVQLRKIVLPLTILYLFLLLLLLPPHIIPVHPGGFGLIYWQYLIIAFHMLIGYRTFKSCAVTRAVLLLQAAVYLARIGHVTDKVRLAAQLRLVLLVAASLFEVVSGFDV